MTGGFEAIGRLATAFAGQVWLVSKCGQRVQERTMRWLDAHDFYGRTGVPVEHVRFCRKRADKRLHCEALGLTHFVDDHPEVHSAIRGFVAHQYLFGPQAEPVPDYTRRAPDWPTAEWLILASLEASLCE
jgi:hypothetical protein